MTQPQQHCDHECVCYNYTDHEIPFNRPCTQKACVNRTRPAPAPDKLNLLTDAALEAIRASERERVLDAIIEFTKGNSETIEADDGTLEDAVFLGGLLAKIESHRSPKNSSEFEEGRAKPTSTKEREQR
jgi:hypothetical protein